MRRRRPLTGILFIFVGIIATIYGGEQKHAREIVGRFPKGKAVDVYYDPEKPEMAVLEAGATRSSYLILGIGLVAFIGGMASFLWQK